eukprot:1180764-Prorocentrum_minimum.AAC.4
MWQVTTAVARPPVQPTDSCSPRDCTGFDQICSSILYGLICATPGGIAWSSEDAQGPQHRLQTANQGVHYIKGDFAPAAPGGVESRRRRPVRGGLQAPALSTPPLPRARPARRPPGAKPPPHWQAARRRPAASPPAHCALPPPSLPPPAVPPLCRAGAQGGGGHTGGRSRASTRAGESVDGDACEPQRPRTSGRGSWKPLSCTGAGSQEGGKCQTVKRSLGCHTCGVATGHIKCVRVVVKKWWGAGLHRCASPSSAALAAAASICCKREPASKTCVRPHPVGPPGPAELIGSQRGWIGGQRSWTGGQRG